VDGSVPFVASAGITYAPAQTGFHGSLRLRHFGKRRLDSIGLYEGEETSLINLGLGYRWQQLHLKMDIFNLFDREDHDIEYFYPSRLSNEPAEGVEDMHFHPVEPRSLRIGITYNY
jgi:hypothetical protein